MYRKDYRFFEQNQSQWEREQRVVKEKAVPAHFLSHIYAVYSKSSSSLPSLILCFQGEFSALKEVEKRVSPGEHDILDMSGDEFWIFLAGVKSPEDSVLSAKLTDTFLGGMSGRAKGVVVKVTTGDEVGESTLRGMRRSLAGVPDGEIKIL
jgi:hypothetical protein